MMAQPCRRLKALKFPTPYEAIEELGKSKPHVFIVKPNHYMPGLNAQDIID